MRLHKGYLYIIELYLFSILTGLISFVFIDNKFLHIIFVIITSIALISTIIYNRKNVIRPLTFLIISFFVFLWMRIILNIICGSSVISVGRGITDKNINIVTLYLGITECIICGLAIIISEYLSHKHIIIINRSSRVTTKQIWIQNILFLTALFFLFLFLYDSYRKMGIVRAHNYLNVSESILLMGYRYFTIGKWILLLWLIISKSENRFMIGSTVLVIASAGYLMRGSRGYAICYFFLWLMIYSIRHKIKIRYLILIGISLIFLANFILEYRLGWSVANGFKNVLFATLHQQGASIEPVFGSVIFKNEILKEFTKIDLFRTGIYGIIVDRVRDTGFDAGGFGSSFFAESYFLGFPFGLVFHALLALCVGIMEYAYNSIVKSKKSRPYAILLIFMTTPNLIYIARSSIHDYIFKTISTLIIIMVLYGVEKYHRYDDKKM